mgnify:CR=1 FL=1
MKIFIFPIIKGEKYIKPDVKEDFFCTDLPGFTGGFTPWKNHRRNNSEEFYFGEVYV